MDGKENIQWKKINLIIRDSEPAGFGKKIEEFKVPKLKIRCKWIPIDIKTNTARALFIYFQDLFG